MHDRIMTGFCPLLQARMSLLAAAYKKYKILMLLAKRRLWKLKLKIILYTPKMSLFTECFNKNLVYAQVLLYLFLFPKNTRLIL